MPNPLAQFFPTEERSDGIYITVVRGDKPLVSASLLFAALEAAMVLNYDVDKITDVNSRARGAPERIGPPFEYYDASLDRYVEVTIAEQKASVKISSQCAVDKKRFTTASLLFCLKRKGLKFGFLVEKIAEIAEYFIYDKSVIIAEPRLPVNGSDALVNFKIDLSIDLKPKIREDGTVDFHEIKSFVLVSENQVIAEKVPPTPGTSGIDVTGAAIAPQAGKDGVLPQGKNTHTSPDGKQLLASKTGVIKQDGNLISVLEHLKIPKDIDFSVGNIKYSGDLEVSGSVLPGFSVECDGSVMIHGLVESATITSRTSSVVIAAGLLGKDDTFIFAKSAITLFFAQGASLACDGSVTIDKYCLHCQCSCDTFKTTNRVAEVAGGHIKAYTSIDIMNAGNDTGLETRLTLIDKQKEVLEKKLAELKQLRIQIVEKLEPIKKQVQSKAAIFKKAGDLVTDRQKLEMKKWIDAYNDLGKKLAYVDKKIEELKIAIASRNSFDGYIRITGDVHAGVIVDLYGISRIIKTKMSNTVFRVVKGSINTEG